MKRTFSIRTFGCQMNGADSDSIEGMLLSLGMEKATNGTADLVLYNTCAVRDKAEHRMVSELGEVAKAKRLYPSMKIGILGCAAESLRPSLENRHYVDLIQDGKDLEEMKEAVLTLLPDEIELTPDVLSTHRAGHLSGMVPVIRGCSYMCSYCIVPRTRGLQRSRPLEEILQETEACLDKGSKEIYLLGQNFLAYGRDLREGLKPEEMVRAVHDAFPECRRIRFLTSHPHDVTRSFLEVLSSLPRVAPYFHLPFQSGSDAVLKAMRRITTRAVVEKKMGWIREIWPQASISTDIIIGFPTERASDFDDTLSLVDSLDLDFAYSFLYSPRPQTRAWEMGDPIPHTEKVDRMTRLQDLLGSIWSRKNAQWIGNTVSILVEGPEKSGKANRFTGRSPSWHPVHFTSDIDPTGTFVDVKIERSGKTSLGGVHV